MCRVACVLSHFKNIFVSYQTKLNYRKKMLFDMNLPSRKRINKSLSRFDNNLLWKLIQPAEVSFFVASHLSFFC